MKKFTKIATALLFVSILALAFTACFTINDNPTNDNRLTVTFDTAGGSAVASVRVDAGQRLDRPADPERAGYTFDAWYVSNTSFTEENRWSFIGYVVSENLTLYANWKIITYSISYNVGAGGVNGAGNPSTYTVETPTVTLADPVRDGHIFIGWSLDNGIIAKGSTGNKSFTAIYNSDPNAVMYNLNGGTNPAENLVSYTRASGGFLTLSAPTRTSYTFDGFYSAPDFSGSRVTQIATSPAGIVTLYAKWYSGNLSFTLLPDESGYRVQRGSSSSFNYGHLLIPDTYNNLPIKAISGTTFANNASITALTMPETVTEIGDSMFSGCANLADVTFHSALQSIGLQAFSSTALTQVDLSATQLTQVSASAFSFMPNLTTFALPDNLEELQGGGTNFLNGSPNMESLTLKEGNPFFTVFDNILYQHIISDFYGDDDFHATPIYAAQKATHFTLHEKARVILWYVFNNHKNLHTLTLNAGLRVIESNAFLNSTLTVLDCTHAHGLTSVHTNAFDGTPFLELHPDAVVLIGTLAYKVVQDVSTVTFPAHITTLADNLFANRQSLKSVDLGNVTHIGSWAFANSGLTQVLIPHSVQSIGTFAFGGCDDLTDIFVQTYTSQAAAPQDWQANWNGNYTPTRTRWAWAGRVVRFETYGLAQPPVAVYNSASGQSVIRPSDPVPYDNAFSFNAWYTNDNWTQLFNFDSVSYNSVAYAGWDYNGEDFIIEGRRLIEVTSIGKSKSELIVPSIITRIDVGAFSGCTNLTSITIPNSVTTIGSSAFSGCTGLTSITIPNSVTEIGLGAFSGCTNLTSITIPFVGNTLNGNSGTHFGWIFGATTATATPYSSPIPSSLNTVVITGGNRIGYQAFTGCILASITIPASVTRIAHDAFGMVGAIIMQGTTPPQIDYPYSSGVLLQILYGTELFVPASAISAYRAIVYSPENIHADTAMITESNFIIVNNAVIAYFGNEKNIEIPVGVTSVFINTGWEFHSVTIPASVTRIFRIQAKIYFMQGGTPPQFGASAESFYGNSIAIIVPASAVSAYREASPDSSYARKVRADTAITITNNKVMVGNILLAYIGNESNVIISSSVAEIEWWAWESVFSGCTGLTSITVDPLNPNYSSQDGILYNKAKTQILYVPLAFSGHLVIPNSVTSINTSAFYGCTGLTSITVDPLNPNYASQDGILYNKAKTEFILIPQAISGHIVIPNGITNIVNNAFQNRTSLTSIEIPDSVTSIETSAFSGCTNLTSIMIDPLNPNYSSQDGILYNKAKTEFILIPRAISGHVVIPNSITRIGPNLNVFNGLTGLTAITIPSSVTMIGMNEFRNCTNLTDIYVQGHTSPPPGWNYSWNGSSATVHWGQ